MNLQQQINKPALIQTLPSNPAFRLINSFLELSSRAKPELNEWIKLILAGWIG